MNPTSNQLAKFLVKNNIKTLNVAGSRKIQKDVVKKVLLEALSKEAVETSETAKENYDKMFVSNIRWWEAQNRLPISDLVNREKGEFLRELKTTAFILRFSSLNRRILP